MIATVESPAHVMAAAFVPPMQTGDAVPAFALREQYGAPFSLRDGAHTTIVSFAYARCPDPAMCPLVTAKFARLQRLLRGTTVRLAEIDLDPGRDRPGDLERYAKAVGASRGRWSFVTSDVADLDPLERRFGIVAERLPSGAIRHGEAVAIVSPAGTVQDLISGTAWSADDVAAEARADAGLPSDPVRRVALALFASASALCGGGTAGGISVFGALGILCVLVVTLGSVARRIVAAVLADR